MRLVVLFVLAAALLFGETFKLYLKDGSYHLVSQYQVEPDRIRYYSTERGEWEEIPKDLVDLAKTEQQRKAKDEKAAEEARAQDEEERAEREFRREIASIPMETGAYFKQAGQIKTVPAAEYQIVTDRKRKAIQVLSPVPLIPGKASVVIKGEHSSFLIKEDRPEFYLRLAKEERFGIVRLSPKKNARIVENISIIPVSKEAVENRNQMDTFEQQLADGLYKVWPEKPLTPGEYALIEFAGSEDKDDIELLIWDFAIENGK